MTAQEPVQRRAARVLLIDARERLLLFRGRDPARPAHRPYWFTVGGGLEPGERAEQGALRETYEETGLRLTENDLSGPVWDEVAIFGFDGRTYRQSQVFFVARVQAWEVDTAQFAEVEARTIDCHRWWSAAELAATEELYYPQALPTLLLQVLPARAPGGPQ